MVVGLIILILVKKIPKIEFFENVHMFDCKVTELAVSVFVDKPYGAVQVFWDHI